MADSLLPLAIEDLTTSLRHMPGVGKRSAQKLALDVLQMEPEHFEKLTEAMETMRKTVRLCRVSGVFSEQEVSSMLSDPRRNQHQICLVEKPTDVLSLEKSEVYHGTYHVLQNLISPLDNVFVDQTTIPALCARLEALTGEVELILFLRSSFAADATVSYIREYLTQKQLSRRVNITRLAQGLPLFFNADYLDQATMVRALEDRRAVVVA
jgi:recombination protein RecR